MRALTLIPSAVFFGSFESCSEQCSPARSGSLTEEHGVGTDPTEREWLPHMSTIRRMRMECSGDKWESANFSHAHKFS